MGRRRLAALLLLAATLLGCAGQAVAPTPPPFSATRTPAPTFTAAPSTPAAAPPTAAPPLAGGPPTPNTPLAAPLGTMPLEGLPPPAPLEAHLRLLHPELPAANLELMPHYVVSATVAGPRLSGTMALRLPNSGAEPLSDVVLRLYGNGATLYPGARMEVRDLRVDGAGVPAALEAGVTALRIALPTPLKPGAETTITLRFSTEVPTGEVRGYGLLQATPGVTLFGSPFPMLALRDGANWRVPAVPLVGDAVSSPMALWDIFLRLPDGVTLVSSGEALPNGAGVTHVVSGPVRDVALALLPGDAQPIEREVAGTRLRYWPSVQVGAGRFPAADAAQVAAAAVEIFRDEFGPPPYAQIDLVEAPQPLGGYEYPGLLLFDGAQRAAATRDGIDFLVPHELAHQWFYALVGNDATREPWIDEGLATYAQLRFLARSRGAAVASQQRAIWAESYATDLARRPVGVNRPVFAYNNWVTYRGPTYYASALLFDDLRQRLGDAAFREAMRRLTTRFAFREATSAQVVALFDEVAAEQGISLNDLWVRALEP